MTYFITEKNANKLYNQASAEKINWYVRTMQPFTAIKKSLDTCWIWVLHGIKAAW